MNPVLAYVLGVATLPVLYGALFAVARAYLALGRPYLHVRRPIRSAVVLSIGTRGHQVHFCWPCRRWMRWDCPDISNRRRDALRRHGQAHRRIRNRQHSRKDQP